MGFNDAVARYFTALGHRRLIIAIVEVLFVILYTEIY